MELTNMTVWVVSCENDEECFSIFSSNEYANEYKKTVVEKWEKSIMRDTIPLRLTERSEIIKNAKNYPEVIQVGKDHYELAKRWSTIPGHPSESWYYRLMSNESWDIYYKEVISKFVIKDYTILK